ncbi:MAG: hypothetical protein LBT42_03640, partial [Tannerella sp.]|jgi:hypothetical protein|nr:hypothetical protein [Tannerella sp.]
LLFLVHACDDEQIVKNPVVENKYDPSLPVMVNSIKPTYGGIDGTFVVEGNFPGDLADMGVYFGEKKAVIVATDGRSITGIVPKQPNGYNNVSVVVGNDILAPAELKFKYKQTRSVKTIAGVFGDATDVDGEINASRFNEPSNIATVKGLNGDNIIVCHAWWNDRVRLISLDDNKVVQLHNGVSFGTPGVDNTREKFYLVGHWADQHNVYSFSREDGWTPRIEGIKLEQSDMPGDVHSCKVGKDDNFLYVLDAQANFAEVDLKNRTYRMIQYEGYRPTGFNNRSQLAYSKYHDCFFASFPVELGILKIWNDNGVWKSEKYAGWNGAGSATGHRLNDAQFIEPNGLTVNDEGEIFVVNRGGHFINKISGDLVELVAGKPGSWGTINGDPLDARFDQPQDIAVDFEGNFYIAGGADRTIRKLSIE